MPLFDRVAAKEKEFADNDQWEELIAYWDARDRERDRAYYRHKDSINISIMEKAFLEEEELMDLEKIYQICKDNVCDIGSLEFNYLNIHEIVSDPKLAKALKRLTEKQKFVLYLYAVEWYKTNEDSKNDEYIIARCKKSSCCSKEKHYEISWIKTSNCCIERNSK